MSLTKGLIWFAGAAVSLQAVAVASEPTASPTRDEVRAIVAEMLADSETRSSLLATGATAGWDKKFFLASASGDYRMNFSGYGQVRYTANFRSTSNRSASGGAGTGGSANLPAGTFGGGYPTAGDDFNPGWSVRRAAFQIDGNVIDPALMYLVRISMDTAESTTDVFEPIDPTDPSAGVVAAGTSSSLSTRLIFDDVFFRYNLGNGWYVKWGQYKIPFLKEELNHENYTMSADRGMVNLFFTQNRSQGAELGWENNNWWWAFDVSDGINTLNTPFGSTFNNTNDIALTSRLEYIFAGDRDQLKDYTSKWGEPLAAYIGAAIHWQMQNNDPSVTNPARSIGSPANRNILGVTVDGQVEGSGLSLYVAGVFGHTRARNVPFDNTGDGLADGTQSHNFDDFGVVVQGAWRFLENTELFVRWDGLFLDKDRNLFDRRNFNFITAGFNQYLSGHAAKLTLDAVVSTNHSVGLTNGTAGWFGGSVINLNSSDATGLLGTARGIEISVRFQAQIMF